ncbi:MAG: hypothetical protein ACREXP_03805 [Steroidobacteraceae bacterium]
MAVIRIALVLRSGGDYKPEHVQTLAAQLRAQGYDPLVLSDVDVKGVERVPLKYKWPGWWAKLELNRPDIEGDLLVMDLDTRIVGDIADIAARMKITLVDDFYRPGKRVSSGLMYLPAAARAETWERWHPQMMHVYRGDGEFMDWLWRGRADTWPEVLPGQVVSYKCHVMLDPKKAKHVGDGTVPKNARIVLYHGAPRPWDAPPLKVM